MSRKLASRMGGNLFLLSLVLFVNDCSGYGKGAPNAPIICETMLPKHNVEPQTTPSPYKITLSESKLTGGDTMTIKLEAPEGEYFKGYLVLVKKAGGDTKKPFGQFNVTSNYTQALDCFGEQRSAVTHTKDFSSEERKTITLDWVAPDDEEHNDLEVVVTFVKEWDKIWQAVKHSQKVSVKRQGALRQDDVPAQQRLSPQALQALREYYGPCSNGTKGCLGIPSGCIRTYLAQRDSETPETCSVMLSWSADGEKNSYALTGLPGANKGYIAMGFSEDDQMGKDSVVGCFNTGITTEVGIRRFKNPERFSTYHEVPTLGVESKGSSFIDGHIFCKFEQKDHSIPNILAVKIRQQKYHILLARGASGSETGLSYHSLAVASEDAFDIFSAGDLGSDDQDEDEDEDARKRK